MHSSRRSLPLLVLAAATLSAVVIPGHLRAFPPAQATLPPFRLQVITTETLAPLDLAADRCHPAPDGVEVRRAQQARRVEHVGMGE